MAHLNIKRPGAPAQEAELGPGCHRIGRSLNTDLQIPDDSVSSAHCELTVGEGAWGVKDLGSTNGTFIDGCPVTEGILEPGQTLRLGQVEIQREGGPALEPVADEASPATVSALKRPGAARLTIPTKVRGSKSFYGRIPGAFAYPFKGDGWGLLIAGTLVFGSLDYLYSARFGGIRVIRMAGVVAMPLGVIATGYIFLFMQSIITLTAMGDETVLNWPDFENIWDSAFRPFLLMMAIIFASMLPALVCGTIAGASASWVIVAFGVMGLLYLPMSLLAVSIFDSVFALNPMVTFLGIARAPGPYSVCCGLLAVLWLGTRELQEAVRGMMSSTLPSIFISEFLFLYSMCVVTRLLGLLYLTKRKELGWRLN